PETVGIHLAEREALGALGEIGIENDDVGMLRAEVAQCLAVRVTRGLAEREAGIDAVHSPPSSCSGSAASARASSSCVGATPGYRSEERRAGKEGLALRSRD